METSLEERIRHDQEIAADNRSRQERQTQNEGDDEMSSVSAWRSYTITPEDIASAWSDIDNGAAVKVVELNPGDVISATLSWRAGFDDLDVEASNSLYITDDTPTYNKLQDLEAYSMPSHNADNDPKFFNFTNDAPPPITSEAPWVTLYFNTDSNIPPSMGAFHFAIEVIPAAS